MPQARQSGLAMVNGISMYYAVYGEGPPVLMIHGGLAYADVWTYQARDLANDHTVIVADSRGHGRSTRNAEPYGYHLMAEDYVALLDYLKVGKAAVVGWSDGANIGLDMAMNHPDRISRLFSHAGNYNTAGLLPGFGDTETFQLYIARMKEVYLRISPTPQGYDDFLARLGLMWESQPDWTLAELGRIGMPVTVVLGDHDEAVKREHTESLAAAIPNAKLVMLLGVSHFAIMQDHQLYTAAIRTFLTE
jgi:pimeloyl-ACP methyl ester carboxylesterase